jgi:hypothetical protein
MLFSNEILTQIKGFSELYGDGESGVSAMAAGGVFAMATTSAFATATTSVLGMATTGVFPVAKGVRGRAPGSSED